jgi:hypothetical protein
MACDTHWKTIGRSKVILLIWHLFGDPHYLHSDPHDHLAGKFHPATAKLEIADGACVEATQPTMEVA